ncbi:MAG: LmbE family protein [Candidatus Altiarchaeales archaeon ex4484_96]|nr:MAG: LmbE family protein [Candidatus Altiarchaeales archaeon ex4484_96]
MFDNILVLSPHTDDGELGAGGCIARFVSEGKRVSYVALSACEQSVPDEFPPDILKQEVKKATKVLGISSDDLLLYGFEVRMFPQHRQEILDTLLEVRDRVNPDLVLTPSSFDTHQDHEVVRAESLRAFKMCSILGYEQPWNNITFNTSAFVSLSEGDVRKKIDALECYVTQKDRKYLNEEFIRGLATTRGTQINEKYAEAFEVIRWVIK